MLSIKFQCINITFTKHSNKTILLFLINILDITFILANSIFFFLHKLIEAYIMMYAEYIETKYTNKHTTTACMRR